MELAIVCWDRSNPGTPTQPRRPDFISVSSSNSGGHQGGGVGVYYDIPGHQRPPNGSVLHGGSPQRRFLSEGELVRQGAELSYARTNNTVDNIRELAGSPQRGVYMWKDTSPGYQGPPCPPAAAIVTSAGPNRQTYDYYRSNPTSPTQQGNMGSGYQPQRQANTYHPALRGGVPVYPPNAQQSPQVRRKATPGGAQGQAAPSLNTPTQADARRRPMSFVRALEMSDSVEMGSGPGQQRPGTPDRTSVYDMNYEISV